MQRKEEQTFGGAAMSLAANLSCLQRDSGGVEREATLAMLEKQLICPICLELFNKPVVILPCEHNLCRKCANELYQPSLFQARTTMLVNSGRFHCPTCRNEVVLDRHGVYGLQRNLLVENIIDIYKQEVSNAPSPVPPPTPSTPSSHLICSDHEGEKVNIFCLTCQVPTCSLCKVFGAHQSCQVAPLTDVYQLQKDELSEEINSLVAVNDKVQALINELEETCRSIEENSKTQKQSVCVKFDHMFCILEERRKVMTEQISSEQDEKTKHAQGLMRCYRENMEANSKLMERGVSSMEEPDIAAFVQNSRELITEVILATSSCPTETLKPGHENMSRYRFNFSRQERAVKSIDFIKVGKEVPEKTEMAPEPEELKDRNIQNMQPNHLQENSAQNPKSDEEPVREFIPVQTSPQVEVVQRETPIPAQVSSAPHLLRDSVESAGAVLQPHTDELDLYDRGSVLMKNERCVASDSVKEGDFCEGMSTQQCEGGSAEGDAGDWMTHRKKKGKQHGQDEEEEKFIKDRVDTTFYPGCYKPSSNVSPAVSAPEPDHMMCSTQSAGDYLSETRMEDVVQAMNELQVQPQPPWSQTEIQIKDQDMTYPRQSHPEPASGPHLELQQLPLFTQLHSKPYFPISQPSVHSENHPQHWLPVCEPRSQPHLLHVESQGSAFAAVPHVAQTQQRAGEAGMIEEENEEEEDMQGWVCLPGTVDTGLGLVERRFDFGDGSLARISDGNTVLSMQPEDNSSNKDSFKLSDGKVEDAEENKVPEEDTSGLIGALQSKVSSEAEMREKENIWPDETREWLGKDLCDLENVTVATKADSWGNRDKELESRNTSLQEEREWGFEAVDSGFAKKKDEYGKDGEQPQDKIQGCDAGTKEKITSCVSLQAVTLLIYFLAFLVILQRVWAYIGCFICT
ncbi:uncharacterized protein [Channa argus]|uniref:uncharacterized protein isoform X2 n=1 Tax=Channa argus TaxID=215402 RepID=UPI0029470331|nr:hypothetical protein Q8A73_013504 [Channa argus]